MRAATRSFGTALLTVFYLGVASTVSPARVLRVNPEASDLLAPRSPLWASGDCVCDSVIRDSVKYKLQLPSNTYVFGATVPMTYTLTNMSSRTVIYWFRWDCFTYSDAIPDTCGNPDACPTGWHPVQYCFCCDDSIRLWSHRSRVFTSAWQQQTTGGYRARPGAYHVRMSLAETFLDSTRVSIPIQLLPYGPETIQSALDRAQPGDTVIVAPGTYYENLNLLPGDGSGVVLLAEGTPQETIIDGGSRGSVIYASGVANTTAVQGFTIRNGSGSDICVMNYASFRIVNNIIRDGRSDEGGGVDVNYQSFGEIVGNLFLNNQASGAGGAIYLGEHSNVDQNTFVGNSGTTGGAVYDWHPVSQYQSRVRHNIFYKNTASVEAGGLYCTGGGVYTVGACDDFWQNTPDDFLSCVHTNNFIVADPKFCAPDQENYTLQDTSPCAPLNIPACGLIGAFGVGCLTSSVGPAQAASGLPALRISPNPMIRSLGIRVSAPPGPGDWQACNLRLTSVSGRRLRSWTGLGSGGTVFWDGRDERGQLVGSGLYILWLSAGGRLVDRRTVVVLR